MKIIPANFQISSFKTVGGDRGDRQTDIFTNSSPIEKSELPPHSTRFARSRGMNKDLLTYLL